MKTINKTGLQEIANFLVAHHKDGENLVKNESYMQAWATKAENDQDSLHIELRASETWKGETKVLDISPAGIDSNVIIDEMEWNDDLIGYILTLDDGRTVQIQFNIQQNRLHGDFGTHYPIIDKENSYDFNISDDEEEQIRNFIRTNKTILSKAEELDNVEE